MAETFITIYRPGKAAEKRTAHHLPERPGTHLLRALLCVPDILGEGTKLEHVSVLVSDRRADMFCDEDFIEKNLPFNAAATKIYRAATLRGEPDISPKTLPDIRGTAVVFSRPVWS